MPSDRGGAVRAKLVVDFVPAIATAAISFCIARECLHGSVVTHSRKTIVASGSFLAGVAVASEHPDGRL